MRLSASIYNKIAKAFRKKGVTPKQLLKLLQESKSRLTINGRTYIVSVERLMSAINKVEEVSLIERIRAEVSNGKIRTSVLEKEYNTLKEENFI